MSDTITASVKLFELGVRTPGVYFGRMVRQGYRFSAFFVRQAFRFSA